LRAKIKPNRVEPNHQQKSKDGFAATGEGKLIYKVISWKSKSELEHFLGHSSLYFNSDISFFLIHCTKLYLLFSMKILFFFQTSVAETYNIYAAPASRQKLDVALFKLTQYKTFSV
jgi:hypothetical protein